MDFGSPQPAERPDADAAPASLPTAPAPAAVGHLALLLESSKTKRDEPPSLASLEAALLSSKASDSALLLLLQKLVVAPGACAASWAALRDAPLA